MTTVALVLDEPLRLLDHHLGDLDVAGGGLVERARDHFAPDRALHLRHLLRPFVDEEDDEVHLRVVARDGLGDVLEQHRLAGLGRRHDEAALALPDRRREVDDPGGEILGAAVALLQGEAGLGKERGQVLEEDLVAGVLRLVQVELVHLEQREVPLAVLRRADLAGDSVPGAKPEASDLARGDVDVVRPGEIGAVRETKEAESVLEYLEDPVALDVLAPLGARLEQGEDDLLLSHPAEAIEPHRLAEIEQ